MAAKFVLDACALLSFIYDEPGCDIVEKILEQSDNGDIELYMNKYNLLEVYYDIRRTKGFEIAENYYSLTLDSSVIIIDGIADDVFREAGRLKNQYKISLADAVALGQASVLSASILTSDHHEFDTVESNENIDFTWIR